MPNAKKNSKETSKESQGESQEQESEQAIVADSPTEVEEPTIAASQEDELPAEVEPTPEVAPQPAPRVLTDPTTGMPLRNQHPGVPDSPWVGKHAISDADDPTLMDKKSREVQARVEQDWEE
jgi:hypothetical protein